MGISIYRIQLKTFVSRQMRMNGVQRRWPKSSPVEQPQTSTPKPRHPVTVSKLCEDPGELSSSESSLDDEENVPVGYRLWDMSFLSAINHQNPYLPIVQEK